MKKAIIAIVVLVLLGGGVYWVTRDKSKSPSYTSNTTTPTNTANTTTADVNNTVLTTKTVSSGKYLADLSGMTLYTYDSDTAGVSKCTGSCLSNWPAYTDPGTITSLPADVTSITRSDNGKKQFAYKGKPLYYFTSDVSAGQVTGDIVDGFSLAKP